MTRDRDGADRVHLAPRTVGSGSQLIRTRAVGDRKYRARQSGDQTRTMLNWEGPHI